MLRALVLVGAVSLLAEPALAREIECLALVGSDAHHVTYELVPGYSIERQSLPLVAPRTQGAVQAITCMRSSLYLTPNDIYVLTDLGLPLIVGTEAEDDRLLVFDMSDGQFHVRVNGGVLTASEKSALRIAIARMPFRIINDAEGL